MKKEILLALFLIAVISLSGCNIPGFPANGEEDEPVVPPAWEYECPDGKWVKELKLCVGGESLPSELEDCGSMENTHLLAEADQQTEEEKAAVSCFHDKILQCTTGSFELTGEGGTSYTVDSEDGDDCVISMVVTSTQEKKTCNIPNSFIASSSAAAEQTGKPEMLLLVISLGMMGGQIQDTSTGQTITFECT